MRLGHNSIKKFYDASNSGMFSVIIIAIAIFKMYDYLTTRYKKFSKVIVAEPILLVKDGKILYDALLKARISKDEFESYLRLSSTDDISNIRLSYLEINGEVSFIKKNNKENEKLLLLIKAKYKYFTNLLIDHFKTKDKLFPI
jgi:uncharacterized membrane protein YcaP (DUF421 family)